MRKECHARLAIWRSLFWRPIWIAFAGLAIGLKALDFSPLVDWVRPGLGQQVTGMISQVWGLLGWGWLTLILFLLLVYLIEVTIGKDREIQRRLLADRLANSGEWTIPWRSLAYWRRDPITWKNYDHFLSYSSQPLNSVEVERPKLADKDPDVFGRVIIRIIRLRLVGETKRKRGLLLKSVSAKSLISNELFACKIDGMPVGNGLRVSCNVPFNVEIDFPNVKSERAEIGVPIRTFWEHHPYIVVSISTDVGEFKQEFTAADIREYLTPFVTADWGNPPARPNVTTA